MARSIWTGSISFGLVNVPVRVFPAIDEHDVRFYQLDERTGNRIRVERVDEKTGETVDYDHIVKGYETLPGHHVEVTDEEFAALRPRTTKTSTSRTSSTSPTSTPCSTSEPITWP
jgi:DNA end-binding protein Ku